MTERIRAELRRTGGFSGRQIHVRADAADLPPAQAALLIRLVSTLDLAGLSAKAGLPLPHGADLMHYDLSIQRGSQNWQGTFHEPQVPSEVRALLQFLVTTGNGGTG